MLEWDCVADCFGPCTYNNTTLQKKKKKLSTTFHGKKL